MEKKKQPKYPIQLGLNRLIFGASALAYGGLLYLASHASQLVVHVLAVVLFSFVANTLFSLLHEAVHHVYAPSSNENYLSGLLLGGFYPTSYSLQKSFHLSHHQFNRSDREQFDYLHKGDNKFLKYAQWYSILTGIYWLVAVAGALLFLLFPFLFSPNLLGKGLSKQTGADSMFYRLGKGNLLRIRLELVWAFCFQLSLWYFLDVSFWPTLACYAAFAWNWSSLQYADHAYSTLDAKEGAWNLKVPFFYRWFFLNYHAHKVHHQQPDLPWPYLYQQIKPEEFRPHFFAMYLRMWQGPIPYPETSEDHEKGN
ncbi:hypothetical protein MASR2M44_03210 [Bacteroidota bacterium]